MSLLYHLILRLDPDYSSVSGAMEKKHKYVIVFLDSFVDSFFLLKYGNNTIYGDKCTPCTCTGIG